MREEKLVPRALQTHTTKGEAMSEAKCPVIPHGRDIYYMADEREFLGPEGVITQETGIHHLFRSSVEEESVLKITSPEYVDLAAVAEIISFKYGRMFNKSNICPSIDSLKELGREMVKNELPKENSDTLAGYTFLGQFIDHDMAFDRLRLYFPDGVPEPEPLLSDRSPSLDLDSLYGIYKRLDGTIERQMNLYEPDGIRFKVDLTDKGDRLEERFLNDLPRENKRAIVADERSDENLGLSQTVVAFLRFHNAVVEFLKKNCIPEDQLFETAREAVVRHYQWIILHDFLPEMVDPHILKEVVGSINTENLTWLDPGKEPFVPVEFAGAAFRFGHSILQSSYDWNRFFSGDNTASFDKLFTFTFARGIDTFGNVPSNWIIDWRLFYDFSFYGIEPPSKPNTSGLIDTKLTHFLSDLDHFTEPDEDDLPIRNLLRGRSQSLPTGQEVAHALRDKLQGKPTLTPELIAFGPHKYILEKNEFHENTPLWYYVLKEAEILGCGGNRLGPVGSYIVVETLVMLILRSEISILREEWDPRRNVPMIAAEGAPKGFGMADLIKFAHTEKEPLISFPD